MKIRKSATVLCLIFPLIFIISACSGKGLIIRDEPTLPFKYLGNLKIEVSGEPRLQMMDVVDDRAQKNMVGEAATGMSNQRSAITTEGAVNDFVHSRMSKALIARGVRVSDEAKYGWKVRLRKLWVSEDTTKFGNEKTRCDLEISFDLVERKTAQAKYQGNITSEVEGTNSVLDATSSNGPALESCLQVAVNKFLQNFEVQNLVGFKINLK